MELKAMELKTLDRIPLKNNSDINENMIQEFIFDNPAVLGLGELTVIQREKIQSLDGRLDILLADDDGNRYEVEIQMGATDPNHIIRTIEYWDSEKKISPQYNHCAVIVAEEITGRFMNVISLFNGSIPIIALQLSAYKSGEDVSLVFTKIIDRNDLGEKILKHVSNPVAEDNLIFNESQKYNLPIKLEYCKLTTAEDVKEKYDVNINLNDYWLKLKKKIYQKNLFENNLYKWDFQTCMIPISRVILDLARIEMVIHNGFIEVKISSPNNYHTDIYDYLLAHKEEIEKELGFELNYFKAKYWRISIYTQLDVTDKENWENAINWHVFMAKRFDEVFSYRIRKYYDEMPLIESNNFRTQYWLEVAKKLLDSDFVGRETPHPGAWYCILLDDVPLSECRIELHAYTHIKQIKVSVIIERNRQDLFNYLLENKSVIENEFGSELDWLKSQGRRHIRITNEIDINNKNNWVDAIDWQLKTANEFKEVFNHRIIEFYEKILS